jgi:hypothetical protein
MKQMLRRPALIWSLIALVSFHISCNKKILEFTDPNSYNTDNYFNSPKQIKEAANAVYVGFYFNSMMGFEWPELYDVLAFEAEEDFPALTNEKFMLMIRRYQYVNTNPVIEDYWKMLYRMILRANLVLDKGEKYMQKNGDDVLHIVSQSMGEAYFLRGWAYFQLAFNWGRVPIRTSFNQVGNEDAPRAVSADAVWAVAEDDFKKAMSRLPVDWIDKDLGRATKGAAAGFLGKLYLYTKRYDDAEKAFSSLPAKYQLLPKERWLENFGENNENNAESLFEVQFHWTESNFPGSAFASPEGNNNMPVTQNSRQQLYGWNDWANWRFPAKRVKDFTYSIGNIAAYKDPRAEMTYYGRTGDTTYMDFSAGGKEKIDFSSNDYWYRKILNKEYKRKENNARSGNNLRLLRYADVLLMRAECKIEKGNFIEATELINQVRNRVGAIPYTVPASRAMMDTILRRERQLELMGEQSRFNDLKRWGILRQTLNPECKEFYGSPNILDKHNLFPIPNAEIATNLGLGTVNDEWN